MRSRLSRIFSRCKAKALSTIKLQMKMRQNSTFKQTNSGVHLAALSLTKFLFPHAKTSRKLLVDLKNQETKELQISAKLSILNVEPSSICLLNFGSTGGAAPTATTRTMQ